MTTSGRAPAATRRKPEEVRAALLSSARRIFTEQGYAAPTQKDIAAAAGVSTSVLFRHFNSKSQLLLGAVGEEIDNVLRDVLAIDVHEPERITLLLSGLLRHRDLLRALLSALPTADGDDILREIGGRLSRAFTAGVSPQDLQIDQRLILGAATLLVALDDWLLPEHLRADDARVVASLWSMCSARKDQPTGGRRVPELRLPEQDAVAAEAQPSTGRRSSEEVRGALVGAATRLFREHGFAWTSYKDIANAAGASESVLYRHFGGKSSLLAEALMGTYGEAGISSDGWAGRDSGEPPWAQPEVLAELYGSMYYNRQLTRVLIGLIQDPREETLHDTVQQNLSALVSALARGSGEVKRNGRTGVQASASDLGARIVMAMLLAATAFDEWFLPPELTTAGPAPRTDRRRDDQHTATLAALISLGAALPQKR